MGFNTIDFININLDDGNSFFENDLETIIYVRLIAWRNRFKQRKAFKKEKSKMQHGILQDGWIGACEKMRKKQLKVCVSL